ncbi:MAG: RluA family pseudouridine synthase [Prevotella sp.]|nr:RluA family pseudouridine synthase [Prevotella sp.]
MKERQDIHGRANADYTNYTVQAAQPLLEFLLTHTGQSRNKVKDTLRGQGVTVDGRIATRHDMLLQPGTRVSVSRTKQGGRQFSNRWVKIVYEDRWLLVVEKAAGILSMAAGHSSLNVKQVLDDYLLKTRQPCRAHVVHRLDRDTSGLMLYAKDIQTEQVLEHGWHDIVYDRRYVALLSGRMEQAQGTVESYLRDNKAYYTYSSATADGGGKLAITHYRVLQASERYTLAEFRLETGRKNQIRVHAADMGHPVCGDVKYGNGDNPLGRLCLHAYMLCFTHPVTGENMQFATPLPAAYRQAVSGARARAPQESR